MDLNNMIIMGIVGYIGVACRNIPETLFKIIYNILSASMSSKSNNLETYLALNNYITSIDKKSIKSNINIMETEKPSENYVSTLNYGTYYIFHKGCFCIIDKSFIQSDLGSKDILSIRLFGRKRTNVINEIKNEINLSINKDGIRIVTVGRYGETKSYVSQKKPFDSIYNDKKYELIKHIDTMVKNKQFYLDNGIFYKTGILLYGPPGTGKTTMCRVLAYHLNVPMAVFDFNRIDLGCIIDSIRSLPEGSIILFEDIDCICSNVNRDDEANKDDKNTIHALLNLLDGTSSPSNVIFMATTNHIEKIDPALLRAGRFDLRLEIGYMEKELAMEMCKNFGVGPEVLENETFPIQPAHLQKLLLEKRLK